MVRAHIDKYIVSVVLILKSYVVNFIANGVEMYGMCFVQMRWALSPREQTGVKFQWALHSPLRVRNRTGTKNRTGSRVGCDRHEKDLSSMVDVVLSFSCYLTDTDVNRSHQQSYCICASQLSNIYVCVIKKIVDTQLFFFFKCVEPFRLSRKLGAPWFNSLSLSSTESILYVHTYPLW